MIGGRHLWFVVKRVSTQMSGEGAVLAAAAP